MTYFSEDKIEQILLEQLQNLGYAHLADFVVSPERENHHSLLGQAGLQDLGI